MYFKVFGRISGEKDLGDPAKAQRQRVWWGKEESHKGISFGHSGATELLPPPKGKTKDTKLATTQSADAFTRCCL